MKTSLNGARLGAENLKFLEFVDLASRHGFDGIDFSISSAMAAATELGGPELLAGYMQTRNVAPAVFGLEIEWRRDNVTFQNDMVKLREQARFAETIGATRCVTWMPPSVEDPEGFERNVLERFGEIGERFGEHGVRLGLEWVGPHHLRAGGANAMGPQNWIYTMQGTLDLIERLDLPTIGLLVDSYHCYTTGIGEAELARLADSQIVHVHINDAPKGVGPSGALDGGRVLPGDGEIDLAGFVRGLKAADYNGFVATEILASEKIAADPDTAAQLVIDAMRRVGV